MKAYNCDGGMDPEEAKTILKASNPGSLAQAVRAPTLKNEVVLEMLAAQTFGALSRGVLLARKPEIDLLLRVAGTTQIADAIKRCGTRPGTSFTLVNAGASELKVPEGFSGLELPRRALTKGDRQKVERGALLNTKRA